MSKYHMLQMKQVEHVTSEKNILFQLKHPFIVQLCVYYVLLTNIVLYTKEKFQCKKRTLYKTERKEQKAK